MARATSSFPVPLSLDQDIGRTGGYVGQELKSSCMAGLRPTIWKSCRGGRGPAVRPRRRREGFTAPSRPVADHAGVDQHGQAAPLHHAHILVKAGVPLSRSGSGHSLTDVRLEDVPAPPGYSRSIFRCLLKGDLPADVDGKDPFGQMLEAGQRRRPGGRPVNEGVLNPGKAASWMLMITPAPGDWGYQGLTENAIKGHPGHRWPGL
jgi:hypothetical protein